MANCAVQFKAYLPRKTKAVLGFILYKNHSLFTLGIRLVKWFLSLPFISLWTTVRIPPQTRALHLDWFSIPTRLFGFSTFWCFPFTSKTEHFSFPIHPVIGANSAVWCVINKLYHLSLSKKKFTNTLASLPFSCLQLLIYRG